MLAVPAVVLAVVLTACGGGDGDGDNGAEAAANGAETASGGVSLECADGQILIGIAKAQSGVASFFDIAGANGLKVAAEMINEDGGIKGCPIKFIEEDTKSDPAIASQVAKSLIDKGAQILVVADDFDQGIAAAKVGQEAGVLTLSTAASSTQFARAVGDLFFNSGITTRELGNAQAIFSVDKGWKSAFQVIDPGLAYFTEQDDTFREIFEPEGGEVVGVDNVDSLGGQSDFGSTISKIKATQPAPDVIQALMVFPQVGTFVKQLRAAGVDTPVVGNVTLATRELPPLVGRKGLKDVFYAEQVFFEGTEESGVSPEIVAFTDKYEEMFGHFPEQANAPGSFQAFMAINDALQQDDVVDAGSAAAAIAAQTNLDVPGGTLVRWEDGYAVWTPVIVGFDDQGQFTKIMDIKPQDD